MIYLTEDQIASIKAHQNIALNFQGDPNSDKYLSRSDFYRLCFFDLTGLVVVWNKILKKYEIIDMDHEFGDVSDKEINSYGAAWGDTVMEAYENLLHKKEGEYCTLKDYQKVLCEKVHEVMEEQGWIEYDEDSWCSPEEAVEKHGYKYAADGSLVKKGSIDYLKEKLNL